MPLVDDLLALRQQLRAASQFFDDTGDVTSSKRLDLVVLNVEDAIRIEQAADILQNLTDDDAKNAAAMLGRIKAVAAAISADQAKVSAIVSAATDIANIVADISAQQYPAAAKAATDLSQTLPALGL